jgi:hypothetical protein
MSGEMNDPIAALGSELSSVSVSPDFAARVRERIEQSGQAGFSWSRLNWRWILPVSGLAAAAVIATVVLRPTDVPAPARTASVAPPASEQVGTPALPVRPRAVQTVARAKSVATVGHVSTPRDPMFEVITDQPELLRNLSVRVGPGIAVDPTEPAGTYQAPKLEVAPIEVSPIVTFLVPDLRVPVGVTPFTLRVAADQAERSSR